jgi:hypothetical protein
LRDYHRHPPSTSLSAASSPSSWMIEFVELFRLRGRKFQGDESLLRFPHFCSNVLNLKDCRMRIIPNGQLTSRMYESYVFESPLQNACLRWSALARKVLFSALLVSASSALSLGMIVKDAVEISGKMIVRVKMKMNGDRKRLASSLQLQTQWLQ